MKNPWTKKNPYMSMWLSGANKMISSARGPATAAVKREVNKATSAATATGVDQIANFWSNALFKTPATQRKRRKRT